MNKISEYITKAREDKGYSMRKLARLSGIDVATISKIESGKIKNPRLSIIKTLCRYLDITYGDCLYIMELGATYNPNNAILMNYYKNLDSKNLKTTYKNIIGKIREYDKILSYLKEQYNKTDDKDLLIDTIKSYEYENRTNNCIREILEEKILNEYLNEQEV
ncbi:MAG: helix-turn-helix transcriptional regulator [Bacilli bacterium]|nr:helix-turn-helix transcriptional regulator [Bacilli bacterium]